METTYRTNIPSPVRGRGAEPPASLAAESGATPPGDRDGPPGGPVALALLAAAALVFAPSAAAAQDFPELTFDAYGTLGGVYSTEDRADFIWNPTRPDGPGHSETVSASLDSRLGAQLSLRITPELSAVVQAVAEQNHEDEYTPQFEWVYVQYAVTPELTVRAGRRPISGFLTSEHRKVSYTYPWARPPVELYGLTPVFSSDGADVRYTLHVGDWTNQIRIGFGRSTAEFPDPDDVFEDNTTEAWNVWSFENTLQRGGLTSRVSFTSGLLDIDGFDPFFDAFRNFGPEGRAVADRFEIDDTPFQSATVGLEYDSGAWLGIAEVAWTDFNSALGEKLAGYVTGGYRLGPVTPYATYSRVEALSETSTSGLSTEGLPLPLARAAGQLNAGLNGFLNATPVQQNFAVGTRWDVVTGIAVKAQVDFVDVLEDSPGTFGNQQPGFEPGGTAQLFSLSTVFVF